MTRYQNEILSSAIATWGERQQVIKAVEELSELSQALCKWLNVHTRVSNSVLSEREIMNSVRDEFADVTIMLHQLANIFEISDHQLDARIAKKCNRLASYLSAEHFGDTKG